MKTKKLLALVLTICLAFSCIAVVPFTASAADETPLATATKAAVFIGKSNRANVAANVFLPLATKYSGDGNYHIQDHCYVEFTCKAKMLSGSKPIVGFIRLNTDSTSKVVKTTTWVNNSNATYDAATGEFKVKFELNDIPGDSNTYKSESRSNNASLTVTRGTGGNWGAITVGNMSHNNNWHHAKDYDNSFIMTDPCLKVVTKADGTEYTDSGNMIADFSSYNDKGVYGLVSGDGVGNNTIANNHYLKAPTNTWSRDTYDPALVKFVKIDNDYLTSDRIYTQHAATANTREYYTCSDFGDSVKFEKLGTGCYNVIDNDVNKKSVVIGNDGTNKVTNIYLPLYTHRYFQHITNDGNKDLVDGYYGTGGGNIFYHISFKAKRLSGTGQPILGRLYSNHEAGGCAGGANAAYNNSDATAKPTDNNVYSSYNPTTGEFNAIVRFNKGYFRQLSPTGYNEYLTIGNAEHVWEANQYDSNAFDSSFIISDISIQVYDEDDTTLLDSEAAPEMVVDNYSFGPSTDTLDDLSTQHMYTGASNGATNGRKTALYQTAADTWTAEGAIQQIKAINRNACNAACHTLTHHAATSTTREYWSCDICSKNYVDKFASEECDTIYATPKMIAVKASGSRPGNAFVTIDTPSTSGTHYYKFTCDMRVFGDDVPTLSAIKGSWWGGNNAQSETSWTNNSAERNNEGLYASYDANTRKYEAIFKVEHSNATNPVNYHNAVSGAYAALLLGNSRNVGNGGRDNEVYYSSFIFGNPQIVEVDKNNNFAVIGSNICPVISDKTVNFGSAYVTTVSKGVYGDTENTMHQVRNPLSAPVGKWNVEGYSAWVQSMDIPDDTFFTQDQGFAPKMVRTSGSGATYNAISTEAFLKPGETYQFDIDYREFGSPARIYLQTATSSGYATLSGATPTADNVDGAHKSIIFTMPSDARNTGGGNFRIYLGQSAINGTNKNTTTVNFANAQLRWYDTEEEEPAGRNIFLNGAFDFGEVGNITTQNANKTLFGWNAESITTFAKHDLITIPEGFFEGDIGESDYALRMDAKDYAYFRTAVELLPDSVYELSFNYRGTDDDIACYAVKQGSTDLTYTTSLVSNHTADLYRKTYRISTFGTNYQNSNTEANTIIEFRCPAKADGNHYYINNIQLHKVENNAFVGMNMLGDRNAIYDAATYYPQNENDFTFATSASYKANSMIADLGHAWWCDKSGGATGSIVKVNENFFKYLAPATRLAKLTEVLLGKADASNPYLDSSCLYYNPDGKGSTNVLDLVKLKKDIVNIGDEGGAGAEAAAMLSKINNAANTSTGSKTTYKVSKSQTTSQLISTLSNAANGSVVLLERGGVWRVPAGAADGFTLKNGVSLGAYGTGAKPMLIGSAYNYASSTWTEVSPNIWKTAITSYQSGNRPGNVYFYNNTNYKTTPLIGRIIKDGSRFTSYSQLEKEGDVYYDITNEHFTGDKNVYVYSTSNPKNKYTDIEIGEKHDVLSPIGYNTIDNICIKYAGGHGINANSRKSITITNCEIGYVGGTPNGSNETMGNGIQFGLGGSNLTVDSCYVHDCYDAGLTFQSWSGQYTFDGVNFTNNLLVDNFYNIEFFTTGTSANKEGANGVDGTMKNINISGNIMRFAGGWSFNQRQGNQLRCANICVTQGAYYVNTQNLNITGNIFDCTMVQQIMWTWGFGTHTNDTNHPGLTITGNTYYQKAGSLSGYVNRFGCVSNTAFEYAGSTDTLKTAIAKMDTRPTKVAWVNRIDKF